MSGLVVLAKYIKHPFSHWYDFKSVISGPLGIIVQKQASGWRCRTWITPTQTNVSQKFLNDSLIIDYE